MCLIFLNIKNHPSYKLIIAGNRDEFYNRQTQAAGYWEDFPDILGGRDLEAGGTWMGMTRSGKVSMLTNYRDPKKININAPSRGHLVSDFLERNEGAANYLEEVQARGQEYNGFNLVAGTIDQLWYYSNYSSIVNNLEHGVHGLSNHLMDTAWPKVERGKAKFKLILSNPAIESKAVFDFLYDSEPAKDDDLPDTGIGIERERALSSMFIKTNGYGSRCSTVVLVDYDNNVQFTERVYDLKTFDFAEQRFDFKIE